MNVYVGLSGGIIRRKRKKERMLRGEEDGGRLHTYRRRQHNETHQTV
jgi:hypothetical protein